MRTWLPLLVVPFVVNCAPAKRTYEHEGAAGATGMDGSGGGTSISDTVGKACKNDDDCSDNLYCNGIEICEDGTCVEGAPPCTNPDEVNCEVTCAEGTDSAECTIQAADNDGDGYRSAHCTADGVTPGDDCDDSSDAVHPGAEEVCDGLDNDCNGLVDLADGLELSGKTTSIISSTGIDIAWSPTDNAYGISYANGHRLYYIAINKDGERLFPVSKQLFSLTPIDLRNTAIGWNGQEFGVAFFRGQEVLFIETTPAGVSTNEEVFVGSTGSDEIGVVPASDTTWAIVWDCAYITESICGRSLTGEGELGSHQNLSDGSTTSSLDVRIAKSGNAIGVVWEETNKETSDKSVAFSRRSLSFLEQKTETISTGKTSDSPAIAGSSNGFGIAWRDGSEVVFQEVSTEGTVICGPITVNSAGFMPEDMVATPRGYLIVSANERVEALEVLDGCEFGQRFTIDEAQAARARVAAGEQGFGVVWHTVNGDSSSSYYRTFGLSYCD